MTDTFTFSCPTAKDTQALAAVIGHAVRGGEALEFHSDLGGGKTTFMKGLAKGMGVEDVVQSPTFTISQIHHGHDGLELHHFDFYRLTEPGVMSAELAESIAQPNAVVAIEWGDIVHDILPKDRISIRISIQGEEIRVIGISATQDYIVSALRTYKNEGVIA